MKSSNRWKIFVAIFQSLELFAAAQVFTPSDQHHLRDALRELNMTEADLGFARDVGEPRDALPWIRDALRDPMLLPPRADRLLAGATGDIWRTVAEFLDLAPPARERAEPAGPDPMWEGLDPALASALTDFMPEARRADKLLTESLAGLWAGDRTWIAATELCGTLRAEDDEAARRALLDAGIPASDIQTAIAESLQFDPEPPASRYLDAVARVDRAKLLAAGATFHEAAQRLRDAAARVSTWPEGHVVVMTDLGRVRIGTRGDNEYSDDCLLVLDPGGRDTYRGATGAANGLERQRLAAVVDLSGDDTYRHEGLFGAGSAMFGVACVLDAEGADTYEAAYLGQASAIWGAAVLEDRAGDDAYQALALSQSAASVGAALLLDAAGDDRYALGACGQAYAGPYGFALLLDASGNDRYTAGGRFRDFERNDDHYLSLAQGFATGLRPFAGGGVAALVDVSGDDRYEADVYGQGVSYWYSAAFLLDRGGHDTYRIHQYGQGAGIHLSLGLLYDAEGHDSYYGFSLAQGCAHDYAVGMLVDRAGDDLYTAGEHSQGHGMNQSLGLLLDVSGRDAYFARDPSTSQGIGNNGLPRDYGSLGLLLDLDGTDTYSSGALNDAALLRPLYGVIFDRSALP